MLELIEIDQSGRLGTGADLHPGIIRGVCEQCVNLYKTRGFIRPWIGYLASWEEYFVGSCSFKGPPIDGKVQIAFLTFPQFEGKGYASEMTKLLIEMAKKTDPGIIISAHTIPHEGKSASVLRKNGFSVSGTVEDPEDGTVWEWIYTSNWKPMRVP